MRRIFLAGALVLGAAGLGAWVSARSVQRRVAQEVELRGAALGVTVREVRFSWMRPLRLSGLTMDRGDGQRLTIEGLAVGWRLRGGHDARAHVRHVSLRGVRIERGPLVVEWPEAELDVLSWRGGAGEERIHVRQASGGELHLHGLVIATAREAALLLTHFDVSGARVRWASEPVLAPGVWTGRLSVAQTGDRLATDAALSAEALRLALPRGLALGNGEYGAPTAVALAWTASRDGAAIDVRNVAARVGGLELTGRGRLNGPGDDRTVELELAARSDLGAALQTTALRLPAALPMAAGDALGTASFDLAVQGPLARPAELRIVPHLRYDSTPQVSEKLSFLRRPFRFHPPDTDGITLDVRDGAADFIRLSEVPPLFLRTLLISEDAGFYGHPGVDVAEIPHAWATNVERGTSARGASTITQQLVKNLFLSNDKSYGRKLEEAALALLVDAAVPKARILEIYLNVIEWGPNLYGLVPAARHYFGKTVGELTPREMVFLVCVIPSPVRYHQAYVAGHVGPGMDQLMANLLAKLRSVDALSDDAYFDALTEQLRFRPEREPFDL
ncbi:MAG TPA: biosynthetic peptidoglycan transglycosylase [Vicinamibacteria bacterium]|nr:biosynthetic peptidoglycan transglycosylase [Vicinamibacteria bacterium]